MRHRSPSRPVSLLFLATLSGCLRTAYAHTWSEAINVIAPNGTLLEPAGYGRNFHARAGPGWTGTETSDFQKVEPGTNNLLENANVCAPFQAQQVQNPGFPRLQASPGDMIAVRYAENGHVTKEEPGRPQWGGITWIYGTTRGSENPRLTEVMGRWNSDGTGGNKGGKLLAEQWFDDGRCYEDNDAAGTRKAEAPVVKGHEALGYGGLHCQSNFKLPEDAPVNQPYSVFWVWNFSMTADPNLYNYYTFCLDIDVVDAPKRMGNNKAVMNFQMSQPAVSAAVPQYFKQMVAGNPLPTGGGGGGPPPPQTPNGGTPAGQDSIQPQPGLQDSAQALAPQQTSQPVATAPQSPQMQSGAGQAVGVPVDAPAGAPIVGEPSSVQTPLNPPTPSAPPGNLPSVSVPMSLISAGTLDPASNLPTLVSAVPDSVASNSVASGSPDVKTVTQEVPKTFTLTPSMSTVFFTVTADPPTSELSIPGTATPTSTSTNAPPQGTGNVVVRGAGAGARILAAALYGRTERSPPIPTESPARFRSTTKFVQF